jgi:crossover junction endodeoxyribonuclease RuvC
VHAPVVVDCGEIRMSRADPLAIRLASLGERFSRIVASMDPSASAVEAPFHGANARAALQLAHARGVILGVLGRAGVAPCEYTPATVKKTVCGSGRGDKEQVRNMVARLTGADLKGLSSDVADAIAVALCHQAHLPLAGRREPAPPAR